ncbi:toxin-antitoxin (TA) system antitoxin [Phormidium sp. LEGE 05292]|uniref:type II toxin-antitoxin system Phd/YefM family antitoxin n=1 Tax=[Phormidium] sp. LEGE 05292 TaxID=767427 RepID=UPI001881C938|nr:toxin-antitoxin (TA) system antitoxin [Phormidium sp. LEGE 05292]MBE9224688.1 toxin-antitoxin (TA) system antitoxin [Phormidium sp. LEGE 05292]
MTAVQKTIDVSVAQMSVQQLLNLIDEGTEILLTDSGKPLARIVPIMEQNAPRIAGLHPGAISTSNDFDEPLPEEFWTAGA